MNPALRNHADTTSLPRRIVAVAVAVLMAVLTLGATAPQASAVEPFNDISPDIEFYDEMVWMKNAGISTGYADGGYHPWDEVNRDAMAAFMYRLAGEPEFDLPETSPFADITPETQFYKEMAWMKHAGISTGWEEDNTYRPWQPVKRDAMAAFMYRLAGEPAFATPPTSPFTDVDPDVQFYKEMAWMKHSGVSTGWPDNTYRPGNDILRDAMAAFMFRLSGLLSEGLLQSITAGNAHTCALTTDGGVKCWGSNAQGQLGDGTNDNSSTPVDVTGLTAGVSAISAAGNRTCAVFADGRVKCWGENTYGQLGDGTTQNRNTPVDVAGLGSGAVAVTGGAHHTCALTTGGGVKCWGNNGQGQLGNGSSTGSYTPVEVTGLGSSVTAISGNTWHNCAATGDGVKCWGNNQYGQLGDNTNVGRRVPVEVTGLGAGVTALATGEFHSCAVTGDQTKCWGNNNNGQLGDGTTARSYTPVTTTGLGSGVSAITAGNSHTCAITNTGAAMCWGLNTNGQLGDGSTTRRSQPTDVVGLTSAVAAIGAGDFHSCALTATGGAKCWGHNGQGRLGDGTTNQRTTPVGVEGHAPLEVTTSELPDATVGTPYSHTLSAAGGNAPYQWSTTSSLPAGLTLSTAGVLSGTPTSHTDGPVSLVVTVTDQRGGTNSVTLELDVQPEELVVTTTGLPDATLDKPYTQSLTATGGVPPYSWSTSTKLPAGLTLSDSGVLSGTPTQATADPMSLAITVTDDWDTSSTVELTFRVNPQPLEITTNSLPNAMVDQPYSQTLTATGGIAPYEWSTTSTLPDGLSLASDGTLTGTPTTATSAAVSVEVTVADDWGIESTANLALSVLPANLAVVSTGLPDATAGEEYSATLAAGGGVAPYTWSTAGALPSWLSLSESGELTGTPVSHTTTPITIWVTVTDSWNLSTTGSVTLNVNPAPLAIATSTLPAGKAGDAYPATTLHAVGGVAPYTWTASGLPAGLNLSPQGELGGTPESHTPTAANVTITVTDDWDTTTTVNLTLTVAPADLAIATDGLPDATVGVPYSHQLAASGGVKPYNWTTDSTLPAGLALSASGVLSGTPTGHATEPVTIQLTVTDAWDTSTTGSLAITVQPAPLQITTSTLADATVGAFYTRTLAATGGVGPYTWSTSSELPEGLSLSGNGVLSGTPASHTSGPVTIAVTVTDTRDTRATTNLQLTITQPPLLITVDALPAAMVGHPYSAALTATGGLSPYRWTAEDLPDGIELSGGELVGIPTTAGEHTIQVSVTDAQSSRVSRSLRVTIHDDDTLVVATDDLPAATVNEHYSTTLAATGGTAPYSWTASSELPAWLNLSPTGQLSGTPNTTEPVTIEVTVTDSRARTANASLPLTVSPVPDAPGSNG